MSMPYVQFLHHEIIWSRIELGNVFLTSAPQREEKGQNFVKPHLNRGQGFKNNLHTKIHDPVFHKIPRGTLSQ